MWQKDDRIRKSPLKFYVYYYSELEGDCQASIITELWRLSVVFCVTLMSTEQTPVFFAAPKYPAMLSKLAKGRTESYGDSARGSTWQSHEQRFPAALQ